VTFPALEKMRAHLREDPVGLALLEKLAAEVRIKQNPRGIPTVWCMPLIGGGGFFDGCGFADYTARFQWESTPADELELRRPPKNPLLPFLEKLASEIPRRWDSRTKQYVTNDDWLLWELEGTPHIEPPETPPTVSEK